MALQAEHAPVLQGYQTLPPSRARHDPSRQGVVQGPRAAHVEHGPTHLTGPLSRLPTGGAADVPKGHMHTDRVAA